MLMDNATIAAALQEIAGLLREAGENPFKVRAYEKAARTIEGMEGPVERLVAEDRLEEIQGVGEALNKKISELVTTGHLDYLDNLRAEADAVRHAAEEGWPPAGGAPEPPPFSALLSVPGLGPRHALAAYEELGAKTLDDLETAALDGRLGKLKGFGGKTVDKILRGIAFARQSAGRFLRSEAEAAAESVLARLRSLSAIADGVAAGDFRRGLETVDSVVIVAAADNPATAVDAFVSIMSPERAVERGADRATARASGMVPLQFVAAPPERFPFLLLQETGSAEYFASIQASAVKRGLALDGTGLRRGRKRVAVKTENEIYARLDLPYMPPELREAGAAEGPPHDLIAGGALQGLIHAHTIASDGMLTLERASAAAAARGYGYFGVADHSRSLALANGLSIPRVRAQRKMIDEINKRNGIRVLAGIECDILKDGSLDYPDDVLAEFDFVIASIHSLFDMPEPAMTERILRAVAHPAACILGHPTGRLLLTREGHAVDVERVLAACAEHGVAVEINANPQRLDIDWRRHRRAMELGCHFAICPDAHDEAGMDDVRFGVSVARRGGVPASRVINAMDADGFLRFCRKRKNVQ
jgi:DNA polymerase (family X)